MSDLNFFYEFNKEKRKKTSLITLLLLIVLVVFGSAAGSIVYLERIISRDRANIHKQNIMLKSSNNIENESESEGISDEERRIKESLSQLQSIKEYVSGLAKTTEHGLVNIFNALPQNISIISFEFNHGELSLECESFDRMGVASTINNLKEVGIKEVFVPSIVSVEKEDGTFYRFCISAKIQGGVNLEDN